MAVNRIIVVWPKSVRELIPYSVHGKKNSIKLEEECYIVIYAI